MRTCYLCRREMPLVHFRRHAGKPKGRDYRCKRCVAARARESRAANPEAKAEANARYRAIQLASRPDEYRAAQRASDAKYRERKRRDLERTRAWHAANADRERAYREANAERRNANSRAYHYRRRVANHLVETEIVAALWAEVNEVPPPSPVDARSLVDHWTAAGIANTCARGCGKPWREITHAVPLYAGGAHDVTNLVPVCGRCE